MDTNELGDLTAACSFLRKYFDARRHAESESAEFVVASAMCRALERGLGSVLQQLNDRDVLDDPEVIRLALRARRVRLAMTDYLKALRTGEPGDAELERWKVLDADLERFESRILDGRSS